MLSKEYVGVVVWILRSHGRLGWAGCWNRWRPQNRHGPLVCVRPQEDTGSGSKAARGKCLVSQGSVFSFIPFSYFDCLGWRRPVAHIQETGTPTWQGL